MNPRQQVLVVLRKELKDAFRDRRALASILLGALVGPILVGFMLNRLAERQRQVLDLTIPVVGMEHAPALIEWLRQQAGVEVVAGPADPERAVRDGDEYVVVVVAPEFQQRFRASSPAEVRIVSDGSRSTSRPYVLRVRRLLERYNGEIGTMRLVGRGVSPAIASPLQLEDLEVSSAQQRAATILGFIPLFIILAAFTAGMQIATDSTAGERERGSLEPLLVNPAPRSTIAAGKWLAATLAAMLGVLLTTALVLAILRYIPMHEFGVRFRLGAMQIGALLAAVLPMCLVATGIQTYLATFARSFKEAQTYMGILILFPMLPGIIGSVYPLDTQAWMYPIPVLGQHVLAADALGAKDTPLWAFFVAGAGALVCSLLLLQLTTRLLQRERIIFSR
jgi:sodium transport system permease protein